MLPVNFSCTSEVSGFSDVSVQRNQARMASNALADKGAQPPCLRDLNKLIMDYANDTYQIQRHISHFILSRIYE